MQRKKASRCNLVTLYQGVILDPEKIYFDEKIIADVVVDCNNAIIAPGFIDIQV